MLELVFNSIVFEEAFIHFSIALVLQLKKEVFLATNLPFVRHLHVLVMASLTIKVYPDSLRHFHLLLTLPRAMG